LAEKYKISSLRIVACARYWFVFWEQTIWKEWSTNSAALLVTLWQKMGLEAELASLLGQRNRFVMAATEFA